MSSQASDHDLLMPLVARLPAIRKRIGPFDPATGCRLWVGAFTNNGYGTYTLSIDGASRSVRAHRAVFMLYHGRPIAPDMTLHHKCYVTACVNPAHLVEMSQADNNADGATGGASIRYRPTSKGVPRWSVLFRENGRQTSRVFGSLEEAERYAAERQALVLVSA